MFSININLKKSAAIAAIALTSILGTANVGAQQLWMEEVLEKQLQEQAVAKAKAQRERAAKGDTPAETTSSQADRRTKEKGYSKTR